MLRILFILMLVNSVYSESYKPVPMKYLWNDQVDIDQIKQGLGKDGNLSSGLEGITSFSFNKSLSGRFYYFVESAPKLIVEKDKIYSKEALTEFFDIALQSESFESNVSLNPYYFYEKKLAKKKFIGKELSNFSLININEIEKHQTKDSILLLPDTHGDQKKIDILNKLIDNESVDWIALEMLHSGFDLNTYQLDEMVYELKTYLDNAWMSFWPENEDPYLNLIKKAMKAGVKIVSLDYDIVRYKRLDGNHQQANLIFRNYYWSEQIPRKGTGIVFGGGSHFDEQTFPLQSFQNYVRLRSERKILKIRDEILERP